MVFSPCFYSALNLNFFNTVHLSMEFGSHVSSLPSFLWAEELEDLME